MLTLDERVASYARAFPEWRSSWPTVYADGARPLIQGVWCFGQDYRNKSPYYGAYPANYLDRLAALFPEHAIKPDLLPLGTNVLHAFSGSLGVGPYDRCDLLQEAEYRCAVEDLPSRVTRRLLGYDFIVADPPYGRSDAAKYGTPMVNKKNAISALAKVAKPRAYLAWLDTEWPMHRKDEWVTVGQIFIRRSTQHRIRLLSIFERTA